MMGSEYSYEVFLGIVERWVLSVVLVIINLQCMVCFRIRSFGKLRVNVSRTKLDIIWIGTLLIRLCDKLISTINFMFTYSH